MARGRPDDDAIEELIGPICMIAGLDPREDWSPEWLALIGIARMVQEREGFEVVEMATQSEMGKS